MKYLELKKEKAVIIETFKNKSIALYGDNLQYVLDDLSTVEIPVSFKRNMVEGTFSANLFDETECVNNFGINLTDFKALVEKEGFWWGKNNLTDSILAPDIEEWKDAESKTFNLKNTYIFKIR